MRCLGILACILAAAAGCGQTRVARKPLRPAVQQAEFSQMHRLMVTPPALPGMVAEAGLDKGDRLYRVAKTDTLVSIAEKFYGDRAEIEALSNANRQLIKDAGGLKRGLVIVLPAAPAGGKAGSQAN